MSQQTRLESLVQRLAAEFKTVYGRIGTLGNLSTTDKTSLVSAINELRNQIDTVAAVQVIDDASPASLTTTFSASRITGLLGDLKAEILGGADAAYDTLLEIQQALQSGDTATQALLDAVNKRVRYDAAQTLTADEQAQARSNIGAVAAGDIGNTDFDFVAAFEAALV